MLPVYFYIPQDYWPSRELPNLLKTETISDYLLSLRTPTLGRVGNIYSWILQTYLRLKADGFPCTFVGTLPPEGIVIAYWDTVPLPSANLLIVSVLADANPNPYTQLAVIQNPLQALSFHNGYYLPHWPQPGLIPRSAGRGNRFENIGFFGDILNLAPELKSPSWQAQLKSLGFNWHVVEPERWHDYSQIDAVLAVRGFKERDYFHKPATKLFNAWHAGVPAILGCESAFQAERKNEMDYVEVSSPDEILAALKRLRDDPNLRQAMIANGRLRAEETSIESLAARWRDFITQIAIPAHEAWCSASYGTQQSLLMQWFLVKNINGVKKNLVKKIDRVKYRFKKRKS